MDQRGLLAALVGSDDVESVAVLVPSALDSRGWVVPTKIKAPQVDDMRRERGRLPLEFGLGDGEDPTGAQGWHTLCAGFSFMSREACNNLCAFICRDVLRVLDGQVCVAAIAGGFHQEPSDHFGHSQKRGEAKRNHAASGDSTGEPLVVDWRRWFLVVPDHVDGWSLPFLPALGVWLEPER